MRGTGGCPHAVSAGGAATADVVIGLATHATEHCFHCVGGLERVRLDTNLIHFANASALLPGTRNTNQNITWLSPCLYKRADRVVAIRLRREVALDEGCAFLLSPQPHAACMRARVDGATYAPVFRV